MNFEDVCRKVEAELENRWKSADETDRMMKQKKEKKPCQRQVIQIDKNTKEIIHIYKSIAEAARAVGASKGSHITEACQGKLKTAHGFCWQYY